jgi:hypothetical protein
MLVVTNPVLLERKIYENRWICSTLFGAVSPAPYFVKHREDERANIGDDHDEDCLMTLWVWRVWGLLGPDAVVDEVEQQVHADHGLAPTGTSLSYEHPYDSFDFPFPCRLHLHCCRLNTGASREAISASVLEQESAGVPRYHPHPQILRGFLHSCILCCVKLYGRSEDLTSSSLLMTCRLQLRNAHPD